MSSHNYLEDLNPKQQEAVLTTEGPVMIVAGAGAGKTKTITYRILHLIHQGVDPRFILAITFTNKAAKEMKERVIDLLNTHNLSTHNNYAPHMSTFHSLGVKTLKEWGNILGIPRHFTIYDKSDSKKLIKKAIESLGMEPKEHLDRIASIISNEKGRGISYKEYNERQSYDFTSEATKKVWGLYESALKKEKGLDFDDLLLLSLTLLRQETRVREYYQNHWKYIHVDEYQDTNKVQDEIIELLAQTHHNICVVGDTDQNIYSWRGAEIKHMLSFEKRYPDTTVVLLEQNYRSTQNILSASNSVIEKNKWRIPKRLFTQNNEGEKISVFEGFNELDEAHFIAQTAQTLIHDGIQSDDIAVLYRANFQSRVLEEAFLAYGVPYQMIGTKFFERKEVKDMLAYIKASLNEDNMTDFVRIVNVPPRGIGKTTVEKIEQGKIEELPPKTQEKISLFKNILKNIKEKLLTSKPSEAIAYIVQVSGMGTLYDTDNEEDTDRLENIKELVTLATRYDDLPPEEAIEQLLTDTSLVSDQDEMSGGSTGVKLMTVHASKGLEFNTVFVTGLEEDLFPHTRIGEKKKEGEDAEEERRLFYVALTRAKKKLYLTYAQMRTIFGNKQINTPSQFIADIPDELFTHERKSMLTSNDSYFKIDF